MRGVRAGQVGAARGARDGFGELVRDRRVAAGLTQEELAERSGVSVRTISDLERGRIARPRRSSVDLLSSALGLAGLAGDAPAGFSAAARGEPARPAQRGTDRAGSGSKHARIVPRQLPAAPRNFVGRAGELAVLDRLLGETGGPGTVLISAIGGTAGIGKTALAVYWGHQVAGRFPDGQLYVNLRGFDPSADPVQPQAALRGFLAALHVPPAQIPASPDAQAGLYRSLLAGKRMLIVLDNARDLEQVRPLLPGSASCAVIVTSRSRLLGLAVLEEAHLITLDVLTDAEARELLARRLGPDRLLGQSAAASEIIGLCARLPLALAIAAARVVAGPAGQLTVLVSELRQAQDRLDAFDAGDAAASVRAVFSWSYRGLSGPAARMFRLLGVHPGPDISGPAAASLAGVRPDQARDALQELVLASLLAEHVTGRFAFHDLLRAYAAELASGPAGDPDSQPAMHRVLDHYLQAAWAAERQLHPTRAALRMPAASPGVIGEDFASHDEALHWLQAEHQVLLSAIARAADAGFNTHAWQISCALRTFLDRQGHWQIWLDSQQIGLAAAQRAGDVAGQAHVHRDLGLARTRLCSYQDAHAHLRQAVDLYRQIGDGVSQGNAHLDIARVFEAEGRSGEALSQCENALRLYVHSGQRSGEARALNAIGWYHALLGNFAQTLIYCAQPLDTFRQLGDTHAEASTLDSLGYAHFQLGHYQDAIACYQQALGLLQDLADRYFQALMLVRLGDAFQADGDLGKARESWQESLLILDDLSHPEAFEVRARLRSHDAAILHR
jgi:tetratricopeptide (TPR) repeat protein/transcriptional regulator with XRE-family HTH domain